jgi:hypothetical protein
LAERRANNSVGIVPVVAEPDMIELSASSLRRVGQLAMSWAIREPTVRDVLVGLFKT